MTTMRSSLAAGLAGAASRRACRRRRAGCAGRPVPDRPRAGRRGSRAGCGGGPQAETQAEAQTGGADARAGPDRRERQPEHGARRHVSGEDQTARLGKPLAPKAQASLKLPKLKRCTVSVTAMFQGGGQAEVEEFDICKEKSIRFTE